MKLKKSLIEDRLVRTRMANHTDEFVDIKNVDTSLASGLAAVGRQ